MIQLKLVFWTKTYASASVLFVVSKGREMLKRCIYEASIGQDERRSARFDLGLKRLQLKGVTFRLRIFR